MENKLKNKNMLRINTANPNLINENNLEQLSFIDNKLNGINSNYNIQKNSLIINNIKEQPNLPG